MHVRHGTDDRRGKTASDAVFCTTVLLIFNGAENGPYVRAGRLWVSRWLHFFPFVLFHFNGLYVFLELCAKTSSPYSTRPASSKGSRQSAASDGEQAKRVGHLKTTRQMPPWKKPSNRVPHVVVRRERGREF